MDIKLGNGMMLSVVAHQTGAEPDYEVWPKTAVGRVSGDGPWVISGDQLVMVLYNMVHVQYTSADPELYLQLIGLEGDGEIEYWEAE